MEEVPLKSAEEPTNPPSKRGSVRVTPRVHWSDGENVELQDVHSSHADSGLYFRDGVRRIDFVLVYNEFNTNDKKTAENRARKRVEYERRLREVGIDLEHEPASASPDGKTTFVKLHGTWDFLQTQAEVLRIRMPLKLKDEKVRGALRGILDECLKHNPFRLNEKELPRESSYFTAVFDRRFMDQFVMESKETFFTNAQRSRMVWDCLMRTGYGKRGCMGIQRLIRNDVYEAAYPLHEGFEKKEKKGGAIRYPSERQVLYDTWASPCKFYKYQPLNLIQRYFGEKVSIYFAWLGFYTNALIPAALAGIVCILYGLCSLSYDVPSTDVCDQSPGGVGNTIMCPNGRITNGDAWKLSSSCLFSKVTYVFDNTATVVFAIFMSIWATMFLEFWKRRQAELAWEWDVHDANMEEEAVRPEYLFGVKTQQINPITQEPEPYMPFGVRVLRLAGSAVAVVFLLCLVLTCVFGIIVYRMIMVSVFAAWQYVTPTQGIVLTSVTAATLNLLVIVLLDRLYQSVAWYLTEWEFPRTEQQFEDSYTFKVFLFQFINYYSALFYIAFIKGRFSSVVLAEKHHFAGYPAEACDPAGCMVELLIQLAIIMVGKQFLNNCMEIVFPILRNRWRRWRRKTTKEVEGPRWEKDYRLNEVPPLHMFGEYLEMGIQYGFLTLFVAAFPLAPLFALVNNIIEIRLDAYKFLVAYRRTTPARARDLGIWFKILDGISHLAVLTNACVIAFTSDFVPRLLYFYAYSSDETLVGYAEHSLSWYDTRPQCGIENGTGSSGSACNVAFCRYRDHRDPPCSLNVTNYDPDWTCSNYKFTQVWWHVLVARLAFVLVFEHLVFLVKNVVAYVIPDTPRRIVLQMQREHYLAKQALYKRAFVAAGISDTEDNAGDGKEGSPPTTAANGATPPERKEQSNGKKGTRSNLNGSQEFRYSPASSADSSDEDVAHKGKGKSPFKAPVGRMRL